LSDPELDSHISPFTVKDALYLHDKKIGDVERIVVGFEDKFKTLMDRINEGVSPTMRRVEFKQSELDNKFVQLDAKIELKFMELKTDIKVIDNRFTEKFVEFDRLMEGLRGLQWKLIGAVITGGITAFVSMWFYVQDIKTRINSIPTVIETKRHPR
jgi:hypothetical protein